MSSEHREYSEIHHSEATLYSCRSPRSRLTSSRTRHLRYLCSEAFLDQSTSREFRSKRFSLCLLPVKAVFFGYLRSAKRVCLHGLSFKAGKVPLVKWRPFLFRLTVQSAAPALLSVKRRGVLINVFLRRWRSFSTGRVLMKTRLGFRFFDDVC